jgi:predicted nucleic acid-binding protein
MKILIDTNIIVDVALERQPFLENSLGVLTLANQKRVEGYISSSAISDIYYIIRKKKGKELTLEFINSILTFCSIATVDDAAIRMALSLDFRDFEDGIQYSVAVINRLEAIVTRNPDDFTRVSLPILTPDRLPRDFQENE